jgi:HK97 family phage prohead protease
VFTKSCPVQIKATAEDTATAEGSFEAIVATYDVDSYGEKIVPGAFADSLAEWEAKNAPIPVLWSHRSEDPDYHIGWVDEAKETDAGLYVKARIDLEGPKGEQVYRLLAGKRVTQFSFAYDVLDAADTKADGGESVYELRKLKLYEVGPTLIGVNQQTELLGVKAMQALHALAEVKAGRVLSSKNESALRSAYESIGVVLATLESDDGKAAPAPAAAALPDSERIAQDLGLT